MIFRQAEAVARREVEQGGLAIPEQVLGFAQCGIEQPFIPDACQTTVLGQQAFVECDHNIPPDPDWFPHLASSRSALRYRWAIPSAIAICWANGSLLGVTR